MTMASLITNGTANPFLTNIGVRSFKIIQLPDKSRKLVGFFETWSAVQQVKYGTHPWRDGQLKWSSHFPPLYNRKQKSQDRTPPTYKIGHPQAY